MQFVCKCCFSDKELNGFILSQGNLGNCDYCESKNVEIIPIEELFDFFKELFDNLKISANGKGFLSLIQDNWDFFNSVKSGHKILNDILKKVESPISNADIKVDFSDEILENVNYWFKLKEQLKWGNRYITDIRYLTDEELGWDGFFESKTIIDESQEFFRARLHKNENENVYNLNEMLCPPKERSTAGRANPIGIPYLYLSDNSKTILYEIRASYLDEISVATFSKNKKIESEIIISDFTEIPSLYFPNTVNKRIKSRLLKKIISIDLSKPMRRYDSELDYIPTQFICEFIKVYTNVKGIKFRSSLHDGNNLVIFDQNAMVCTNVKKVQISKVKIDSIEL